MSLAIVVAYGDGFQHIWLIIHLVPLWMSSLGREKHSIEAFDPNANCKGKDGLVSRVQCAILKAGFCLPTFKP